jgi:putative transposase
MAIIKVYIHFIWTTMELKPFLKTKTDRFAMWNHIKENAFQKDIIVLETSGYADHCHCLVSFTGSQNIFKVIQLLKGESSRWMNETKKLKYRFEWDDDYIALSVSASMVSKVRNFIRNQEQLHEKSNYLDEMDLFFRQAK